MKIKRKNRFRNIFRINYFLMFVFILYCCYGSVSADIVSHWSMDEKSWSSGIPDQVFDNFGRNHGTPYDNAATSADGMIGRAGTFDGGVVGDGDYVEVPDSATLDITDSITICAWVKMTGSSEDEHNTIKLYFGGTITNDWDFNGLLDEIRLY